MKYTQEEIAKIYKEHGWIVLENYINNKTPVHCMDVDGYQYKKTIGDVLANKGSYRFHKKNPYTIENINLFLRLNDITLKLNSNEYIDAKTFMDWTCECKREFSATFDSILRGKHYCEFCCRSKRFDGFRDYVLEIQTECDKRGYTLLTKDIKRSTDKFEYICNKHYDYGIQTSTYDQMVNTNRGCYRCGVESRTEKHKIKEEALRQLAESKGYIYAGFDYDNEVDKGNKVNIHIICPRHAEKGIQKVKFYNLKHNKGLCKYCLGYGRTQEDLQRELDEMHGDILILKYDKYMNPILVQCRRCGYTWWTSGMSLTQGHKCPNCNKSMFEIEVAKILDKFGYRHKDQHWYSDCRDINPLPFDFYLFDANILIEADGEGHYKPIRRGNMTQKEAERQLAIIQEHDKIKTQYCINNNIPLIRIPYWERKNLECFLFDELNKILTN